MRKPVMILVALSLAACGTMPKWVKSGATQVDFDQDKLICEYEAKKATGSMGSSGLGMGNAIADGIEQGMREGEIGSLCMKTKGWSLERVSG